MTMNRLTAYEIGKIPVSVKGKALQKAVVAASMKTDCDVKVDKKSKKY